MIVVCPECDLTYVAENPDDVARHREHCAIVTAPDNPKPNSQIATLVDHESGIVWVERSSDNLLHERIYQIACRFKREMEYDAAAWAPKGYQTELGSIGVLFCDSDGRTLGGAAIFQHFSGRVTVPVIGWIWIARKYRRRGVFGRALPCLCKRFPGALLNEPYSEDILFFAEKSSLIRIEGKDEAKILYLAGSRPKVRSSLFKRDIV